MSAARADSLSARALRASPLVVAAVTLALAGPVTLAPVAVLAATALAVIVGPRLPLDRPTVRLASLVIVILVIAGVRAAGISTHAFAFGAALAPLLVAVLRLLVVEAEWGYVFTALLSFVAMLACGASRLGPLYGALVVASLSSILVALRAEDPNRAPAARVPRRAAWVGAGIVASACLFATGAALVLRPLQAYAQRRITESFEAAMMGRVMFSDSMHLGKMKPLWKSNRVVLRLRGRQIDWLRGAVLDRYDGRRWLREGGGEAKVVPAPRGPLVGDDVVTIEKVGDDGDRWFLPLDVASVATATGALKVDGHGVARMFREDENVVWARVGARAVLPVDGVARTDLQMPAELRRPLALLASHWAAGSETPAAALEAVARHLRAEYKYSLEAERNDRHDPVLDFLFEHREGHCEYFASAFALLARSIGIPARVVTGYRVAEKNPILGHYVVRERNAHAWVEAWLDGRGWVSFDPTPTVELAQNEPHEEEGVAALTELLLAGVSRVEAWLAERTVLELSIAAGIGLVVFGLVRFFGQKKPVTELASSAALAFTAPLDAYVALEARLAALGTTRRADEPLDAFAARAPAPFAALVVRYAKVRYGGAADARLETDLRAAARGGEGETTS